MSCLGFDTSNYTTSAALFGGGIAINESRLLPVESGSLGLRQSDALFHHVKALPEIFARLKERAGDFAGVTVVAASTRPRNAEGSYMPCFLAGETCARVTADALGVPFTAVAHQDMHVAAAAYSAGRPELLDAPLLAWHLSGGTTELVRVEPDGRGIRCAKIGGTSDISAGQCVDRCGVALGLKFPCGAELEKLSKGPHAEIKPFAPKINVIKGAEAAADSVDFSLSGLEAKFKKLIADGASREDAAAFTLGSVGETLVRATAAALKLYPGLPVLCAGGVTSCAAIRARMRETFGAVAAEPEFSRDNALGTAILGERMAG